MPELSDTENKTAVIHSVVGNERISTQNLLQEIYKKMEEGCTNFEIHACGQHNIGGPLWTKDGSPLKFKVYNPGQRVGSMGMKGTSIVIEGSSSADVGWLNAGAEIILKGDGGDTTAHCAASGKIYVGGRVGTRSGALMKHDPKFSAPEFWVLKNTGSFSFEFMGGGTAVVCGYDCENIDSVLGKRSCVGMVGGTVYVRGPISDICNNIWLLDLDESDKEFLFNGIKEFLEKIEKPEIFETLSDFSQWHKIVAKTYEERIQKSFMPLKDFRDQEWLEGGIFGDLIQEDWHVSEFVEKGQYRLRTPEWQNHQYSAPCEFNCPIGIPTQKRISLLRQGKIKEALELVLDYSPFPGSVCGQVCPNLCLEECNRQYIDTPVKIAELGVMSKNIQVEKPKTTKKQKIAVIGAGAAGLGCAWHLKKLGYTVEVFEQDMEIGGKLKQVIPSDRLDPEILCTELNRLKKFGIKFSLNTKVDKKLFEKIEKDYDAAVIAIGAHNPVVIPFEGHDRLIKGLDFLKAVNKGEKPKIGKKVVVIGAGNAAMDVVLEAYHLGAESVTAIDIQKPAAFDKEIKHVESLGAKILYPCYTEKITDRGVHLKDGRLLEADTVIISVGDRPVFDFIDSKFLDEKGKIKINEFMQSEENKKVFAPGDAVKAGLFTNAIADGRKIALNIDRMFKGLSLDNFEKAPMIPRDKVKTEYYPGLNLPKIEASTAEKETERCLSCGYCRDCEFCMNICPEQAIYRKENQDGSFEYVSDENKCIGCGICSGVCPCGIWTMQNNFERFEEA
jgi:NADPH-dependent glutamate synthase beta subunit-like oxidoreductase/glutamate synthase domain-containing protein 3/ferredoxin